MSCECVFRRSGADKLTFAVRENGVSTPIKPGAVLVDVERSVIDMGHLDRVLEEGWATPAWCSLVGRVAQVGGEVDGIRVGDRLAAIGPAAGRVVLPAQECLPVTDEMSPDRAAYWALLAALIRSMRQLRIEIGESALVLGGGLVGHLAAQLALKAGAVFVVGVDSRSKSAGAGVESRQQGIAPLWVADQDSLEAELPQEGADVLIDTMSDFSQLAAMLPLLRTGGRALSLAMSDERPVDIDLYSDVHRRSLNLMSCSLKAALRRKPGSEMSAAGESEFICHLLGDGWLDLPRLATMSARPAPSAEQVLPAIEETGLLMRWQDS